MCAQTMVHAVAHGSCTDTLRESALKVDWEKSPLPHQGLEPTSVLRQALQSDALPTELFPLPNVFLCFAEMLMTTGLFSIFHSPLNALVHKMIIKG